MSMLGISMLDEIVNQQNITQADLILNRLRALIIKSLHQSKDIDGLKDGMDLSLLIIDKTEMTVQFSGANNPLLIVRNNEILIYKADRMPVGLHYKNNEPFSKENINLQEGDTLYIFSDGYVDQFGGEKNKKFLMKQFKDLLLAINSESLENQKIIIEKIFYDWKGNYPQTDDIIVVGIRV